MIEWLRNRLAGEDEETFDVVVDMADSPASYRGSLLHVDKRGIVIRESEKRDMCFMWERVKLIRVIYK